MFKLAFIAIFLLVSGAFASEFMEMTPIGAECIPVSLELSGSREAAEQLEFDIDFSGILETVPRGEGYAHARCVLSGRSGGYLLVVDVDGAEGEMLLKRSTPAFLGGSRSQLRRRTGLPAFR